MLIYKYDPEWEIQFGVIKHELEQLLNGLNISVQHIGSTSVPGLAAKPIIDIDLIYFDENDFKLIKEMLNTAGYCHVGDQGISTREVFKRIKSEHVHPVFDNIRHHLYVCNVHSEELKRHLIFRYHLRNNNASMVAYQELKQKIAEQANNDRKIYAKLKETLAKSFIESKLDEYIDNNLTIEKLIHEESQ